MTEAKTKTHILQLNGIDRMIIDGEFTYHHQNNQARCMNRSDYANHTTLKA